jgi:hypothetical protein
MGWLSLVGAGVSMFGNMQAARAQLQQNYFMAGQAENQIAVNDKMSLLTEHDIYEQAAFDLSSLYKQEKEIVGQQKAAGAAAGLTADSRTMQDLINDTFESVRKDADMVSANRDKAASRNALNNTLANIGLASQAKLYRLAGSNAITAGSLQNAGNAIGALSSYYQYRNGI